MKPSLRRSCVVVAAMMAAACGTSGEPAPGPAEPVPTTASSPQGTAPTDLTPTQVIKVPPLHPSVDGYPAAAVVITASSGTYTIPVRVADTAERRAHGLMEVPRMPAEVGMWFVFEQDVEGGFWMKGTLVPLDIAWVDAAGQVVAMTTMTPCVEDPCPVYTPGASYRSALEVAAGWFDDIGLEIGNRIAPYA